MADALNFRTQKAREEYNKAYDKTLRLWDVEYLEEDIPTSFGTSHCVICGNRQNPPLVLLHAASCGSTIWYPNVKALSQDYAVYAIDLIIGPSKSLLTKRINGQEQCCGWLDETVNGLGIKDFYLCGLSIGGWLSANYASKYPQKVKKLILLGPVQTFAGMYFTYFLRIMKMGLKPTRKSVEEYLGWSGKKEAALPDSVIDQFAISAMNINGNGVFPKALKQETLKNLTMPVLVLFGENEFAFDVDKAVHIAKKAIKNLEIAVLKNASHLISVSSPGIANERILSFLK